MIKKTGSTTQKTVTPAPIITTREQGDPALSAAPAGGRPGREATAIHAPIVMTKGLATVAASEAANAVYFRLGGKPAAGWFQRLGRTVAECAQFVEVNRNAPPEALYRFGLGPLITECPWGSDLATQGACETFHAVFQRLSALVPKPQPEIRPSRLQEMGKRTFRRRAKGLKDRVKF